MDTERPNPDELLARVQAEESVARRGKLKIFFGYAAGVGKTYAMLEAARREKAEGIEVVVGYVEPHGRPETERLLEGLEALPTREVSYRNVTLREFDLDAALQRRPRLLLVDELAHTNAEGSRHTKRWQDVDELLEAGIDVWSTLNVQHLESLNDVIAQITGTIVRETLPDAVIERADELELVDLTPEELIERLREGKVYIPAQAERALQNFFQKSNLQALRELSLREAADRLRRDVDAARQSRAAREPWATNERLLVCVGPSPTSARLIRTAKRMADAFGCEWLAVAVQTQGAKPSTSARQQVAHHLRMAEELGAETHMLVGENVARTILNYARSRNVTKIIVGKTAEPRWKRAFFGTVVDDFLDHSGDIDIYVIRGDAETAPARAGPALPRAFRWELYVRAGIVVAICGLLGWASHWFELAEANIVMVFLLGVMFVATRYGRGPSAAAALASVLVFDFFFVVPYGTFAVSDAQYVITFGVMLGVGLVISTLAARAREQLRASQEQEHRTAALYQLTRHLSQVAGTEFLIQIAGQRLGAIFDGQVVIFLRGDDQGLELRFGEKTEVAVNAVNPIVAQWVTDHDRIAGVGTDTLPNATAFFVPLTGSLGTLGALGVRPKDLTLLRDPEERRMLESCASMIALSIERDRSVLEAHRAQLQVQTEQLRSSLLSSVSHDLRTPLAAIAGAASSLLEVKSQLSDGTRHDLLQTIVEEAHRLHRLVENLLDMTRLQSGAITLNQQWHVLEEIVGTARSRLKRELEHHLVQVDIAADVPLVHVDAILIEQVLVNLLENAARYTPAGSAIDITIRREGDRVAVRVADRGPGLTVGTEERIFDAFVRGTAPAPDSRRGVGLGLAICRGLVTAHGGRISANNRPGGGAEFVVSLPCDRPAPRVSLDELAAPVGSRT